MKNVSRTGMASILLTLMIACSLPTYNQLNVTRQEPKKEHLVGTWVPDTPTSEMLKKQGYSSSVPITLEIRDDGTFDLRGMPDWWYDPFGQSHNEFRNDSGSWQTSQYGDTGIWQINLRASSGTRLVNLLGQEPPYRMEFVIGDADMNTSMVFIKL